MRDAIDIIGLEVIYNGKSSTIQAIHFIPNTGSIYITLKRENILINVPYKEVYKLIKQQIVRL